MNVPTAEYWRLPNGSLKRVEDLNPGELREAFAELCEWQHMQTEIMNSRARMSAFMQTLEVPSTT